MTPVQGGDGALRYEIHRIWGHQPQGQLPAPEYLVQWKGYDTAQMTWVARKTLLDDVHMKRRLLQLRHESQRQKGRLKR